MTRLTAPSLWLPGFSPEPFEPTALFIETKSMGSDPASLNAENPIGEPVAEPAHQRSNWRVVTGIADAAPRNRWPQLVRSNLHNLGGNVSKFEVNLAAIKVLRQIESEQRPATTGERSTLLRYTGWGGLPASFNPEAEDAAWAKRARQLNVLLAPDEYESARASVNNSHYTEVHVIEAIWQAVQRFGFSGGRILEPAAGIGHFIGAMPTAIAEQSSVTAIEIDQLSGRMLQALYALGGVDVRISPFEKTLLADNWFDLVIGNVPFGKYPVADVSNRAYTRFSIHNYFFGRALDLVRPGGLVCLITSSYTLDAQDATVRHYLGAQAQLLGAIRLPKGAFAGIASTDAIASFVGKRKPVFHGR
jgi:hypothetical protein